MYQFLSASGLVGFHNNMGSICKKISRLIYYYIYSPYSHCRPTKMGLGSRCGTSKNRGLRTQFWGCPLTGEKCSLGSIRGSGRRCSCCSLCWSCRVSCPRALRRCWTLGIGFCVLNFLSILSDFLWQEKLTHKKKKSEELSNLQKFWFLNDKIDQIAKWQMAIFNVSLQVI